jgi:purine-binding chemotaxis protein CheW
LETLQAKTDPRMIIGQDIMQLAIFRVGNEKYGMDISNIKEVTRHHPITRVPKVPRFIEGVINLRGTVIPIVDMRKRFDLGPIVPGKKTRVIIISVEGKIVGVMVDEAREVIRIPKAEIMPAPKIIRGIESEYNHPRFRQGIVVRGKDTA